MYQKALITGITGQDGSYLAEFLLAKGYEVHGIVLQSSVVNDFRNKLHCNGFVNSNNLFLHYGDLADSKRISDLIESIRPDEVYNLGAQSDIKISFDMPEYTGNITGLGTTRLLDAIKRSGLSTRFYQASSSEMFGIASAPQSELTPFYPKNPYAIAKVYSYWVAVNYREAYGMFSCNGILFNHESPRRTDNFVTRKITKGLVFSLLGKQKTLYLGNLDAQRDWGFAPDYVEAMWLMLQQKNPNDFVIGTGIVNSVRSFVEKAYSYVGIHLAWMGSGMHEKGIVEKNIGPFKKFIKKGDVLVAVDERFFRPIDVRLLYADTTKAREILGWEPRVTFDELISIMVDYDLQFVGLEPIGKGISVCDKKKFSYTNHFYL